MSKKEERRKKAFAILIVLLFIGSALTVAVMVST